MSQLKDRQRERERIWIPPYSAFLFHLDLQQIGWGSLTLGTAVCFTQSTDSSVNLIQKQPHWHTQNNVYPNIWALHGPVKLTHKINHHTQPYVFIIFSLNLLFSSEKLCNSKISIWYHFILLYVPAFFVVLVCCLWILLLCFLRFLSDFHDLIMIHFGIIIHEVFLMFLLFGAHWA